MKATKTDLEGCFICQPKIFEDERGNFSETFNQEAFRKETGVDVLFVQDNQSISKKNVLRGFHFQVGAYAQAKLIRVVKGKIIDVCVDLREDSSTYLKHFKIELSATNAKQLFIPKGFAHGFLALEDNTIVSYKCDNFYNKQFEKGIKYNDPILGVDWQIDHDQLIISEKDQNLPFFEEFTKQ